MRTVRMRAATLRLWTEPRLAAASPTRGSRCSQRSDRWGRMSSRSCSWSTEIVSIRPWTTNQSDRRGSSDCATSTPIRLSLVGSCRRLRSRRIQRICVARTRSAPAEVPPVPRSAARRSRRCHCHRAVGRLVGDVVTPGTKSKSYSVSISAARSVSFAVKPPSLWVDSAIVTLFQRMSMSG
jgi:hypothetical protein